nr:WbuC family cupin fold metalloprotein [uncultured Bacteroides sp.]
MEKLIIDQNLLNNLFEQTKASERMRQNYDLRTNADDGSQRMLNAMLPGTVVPIHRHPISSENVICLCGRFDEVLYDDESNEIARYRICPSEGNFGCQVPAGVWHTVEVIEPTVIYEAKYGKFGQDGSETYDEFKSKQAQDPSQASFSNSLGDLHRNIE